MWKAQVRNLERNKIQHVDSTAKHLKKKPALVDNISVEGWVEPGVGGEHCQRYICSLSGKNKVATEVKKEEEYHLFWLKKDHCMEHVCHFSAKLLLFFNEIKRASLGGASAQWADINFLTHLDLIHTCVWIPEDTSDVDIVNVNSWGFWDLGKDNTKWKKNTNLSFYFENLTHLTEEGLCCMRSGRHLQVLMSRMLCWLCVYLSLCVCIFLLVLVVCLFVLVSVHILFVLVIGSVLSSFVLVCLCGCIGCCAS